MRYFLNVRAHDSVLVDREGGEFPNLSAACQYAMRIALDLARKYPRGPACAPLALEVMDHAGTLVFRTPIR